MKENTHPEYREVLFVDSSTGFQRLVGSTLKTKETATYQGKDYPMYRVSVSSASHPYWTGGSKLLDAEGRVDKFNKRYENLQKKKKN